MKQVLIHLSKSYLDSIKELEYDYTINDDSISVILPDVEYQSNHSLTDPDEQFCDHYSIDYDYVHCIELLD